MDLFDIGMLATGAVQSQGVTSYSVTVGGEQLRFMGSGFTYDGAGNPLGGTVTGLEDQYLGQVVFNLSGFSIPVSSFLTWASSQDTASAKTAIFIGSDVMTGGPFGDLLRAYAGNDALSGGGGDDTLDGGSGDDIVDGGAGRDVIFSGAGFDTVNVALGQSAVGVGLSDVISDWSSSDILAFASRPTGVTEYIEATAADYASAASLANGMISAGSINLVVVAVGADLIAFADSANNNGAADDAVILTGRNLTEVNISNFTGLQVPGPELPTDTPGVPSVAPTAGNDSLTAQAGATEIHAGAGNDTIAGGAMADYLRGDDGNDLINGGPVFDDINGNLGDDTAHGNAGDDWVVGGKGDDQLFGEAGGDIVWGNLNNDLLFGGDGNDQVRGGQGDDLVNGGAGNDFVSGDRGSDTITGGLGADLFHGSQDAGIDRVTDFNFADGDRVLLDPGTTYTLSQVGADTVLDMGGGHQMILAGVQASTLPAGWIL
jgi:Ca2+-binding RTX toxin-like protein